MFGRIRINKWNRSVELKAQSQLNKQYNFFQSSRNLKMGETILSIQQWLQIFIFQQFFCLLGKLHNI
ncbi:hypothetical protein pb186bvf_016845 [Paramecium bursaria]